MTFYRFPSRACCWGMAGWLGLAMMVQADPDDEPAVPSEAFTSTGMVSGNLHPGLDQTIRFAVVGDYGVSGASLDGISRMIRGWDPAFIISTGDNTYGNLDPDLDADPVAAGKQNDWEFNVGAYFGPFLQSRADAKFPLQISPTQRFFPTVGNHDSAPDPGNGGTIEGYLDYFFNNPGGPPRLPTDRGAVHTAEVSYYATRQGPVDVFVLDGDVPNRPDLIAAQKTWLAAQSEASTARWKIAVFHQPPFTSGFRAAADWMVWDELKTMDAILCGHDHFYERLDYFGVPLFISGAGGQFLYTFRDPPDARSLSRYNLHHSAMLVIADGSSMRLENRAFELPAQQETKVESILLGTEAPIDNEDTYTFFAESGETIELRTATPPPLSQPALSPNLTLFTPGGPAASSVPTLGADGRNVTLTHIASQSGTWSVKITAAPPGSGPYTLRLQTASPLPDFPSWASTLPAGQRALTQDPDQDGLSNLMEYAFQTSAHPTQTAPVNPAWRGLRASASALPGTTLTFDLPSPLPPGVSYQLEASSDLTSPWQAIAWRAPAQEWQSAPGITLQTGAPEPDARRTAITVPTPLPYRFFRLAVSRNN